MSEKFPIHKTNMDTLDKVKKHLEGLDKSKLVSMLLEISGKVEPRRPKLISKVSRGSKKLNPAAFKKMIDNVVGIDVFVDYRSMDQYTKGIDSVADSLRELCCENQAADLIELSEYFLKRLEHQMDSVDDSDGELGDILNYVQELHHDACVLVKPDPEQLAKKLFRWILNSEGELFYDAVDQYADVLGEKGRKAYTELAEKEWAKLPALKPGDDKRNGRQNRYRITSIMKQLAVQSGDIEQLVAVKMKDLSIAYSYLEIAQIYKNKRKNRKALEWAENGVKAFPVQTDSRLREFLANEYHKLQRHDDAMQIMWDNFCDQATFDEYKNLKIHAVQAGGTKEWMQWREKALQHIRDYIAKKKCQTSKTQYMWNLFDHSELVRIYLWEKNIDAAWEEAKIGQCHRSLWLELAAKREAAYPEDSIAVYRSSVSTLVERKNNESYTEAAGLIKKIRSLFISLGKRDDWENYLSTLRQEQKPKRNFIALLNKVE